MSTMLIRPAMADDAAAVAAIYAPYVRSSIVTFEEVPPDEKEILARMKKVRDAGLPYYVAEMDGAVVAYAYADLFKTRVGYRFAVENSVYVAASHHRRGIGIALLKKLIVDCAALGYRHMVAGIAENEASTTMHAKLGFKPVGTFPDIGLKFGRWIDVVYMQLALGEGSSSLPAADPGRMAQ